MKSSDLKLIKYRTFLEIILFVIILAQLSIIFWLYDINEKQRGLLVLQNKEGIFFQYDCVNKIAKLEELNAASEYSQVVDYVNQLMNIGWNDDKILLMNSAKAYYALNQKERAIDALEKAIQGTYFCEIAGPKTIALEQYETSLALCQLSLLLKENGDSLKAENLYNDSITMARKAMGTKFDVSVFSEHCEDILRSRGTPGRE